MDLRSKESEVSSSGLEHDRRDIPDGSITDTHEDPEASHPALGQQTQRPPCSSLSPPPVGGNPASAAGSSLQESVARVCFLYFHPKAYNEKTLFQLLFMNFKWARDIPSFQQLSSHNQKILLQHSWSQLLVLSLAQLPGTLEQFEAFH